MTLEGLIRRVYEKHRFKDYTRQFDYNIQFKDAFRRVDYKSIFEGYIRR